MLRVESPVETKVPNYGPGDNLVIRVMIGDFLLVSNFLWFLRAGLLRGVSNRQGDKLGNPARVINWRFDQCGEHIMINIDDFFRVTDPDEHGTILVTLNFPYDTFD